MKKLNILVLITFFSLFFCNSTLANDGIIESKTIETKDPKITYGTTKTEKELSKNSLLIEANKAYNQKKYSKAKDFYLQLINLNIKNGYLFYNIANTYYQLKEYSKAFAYYQKAQKYIPRFYDLNHNILLVKKKINAKTNENFLKKITFRESIQIVLISLTVLITINLINLFSKNKLIKNLNTFSFILIIITSTTFFVKLLDYKQAKAIVITKKAIVRSADNINGTKIFSLAEGESIIVLDTRNNWTKIKLNNKRGWIKNESIVKI